MSHTVLRSASREVVIGHDRPFCLIGERINPTGRKLFQEQLRNGDLTAIDKAPDLGIGVRLGSSRSFRTAGQLSARRRAHCAA